MNEAFRFLFDNYYVFLCTIARSYLKDSFVSETIVGDLIYNIWKLRGRIEIKTSLKAYLIRSVKK